MKIKTVKNIDRAISYIEVNMEIQKSKQDGDTGSNIKIAELKNVLDCLKQHKELMEFFKNIEELA